MTYSDFKKVLTEADKSQDHALSLPANYKGREKSAKSKTEKQSKSKKKEELIVL